MPITCKKCIIIGISSKRSLPFYSYFFLQIPLLCNLTHRSTNLFHTKHSKRLLWRPCCLTSFNKNKHTNISAASNSSSQKSYTPTASHSALYTTYIKSCDRVLSSTSNTPDFRSLALDNTSTVDGLNIHTAATIPTMDISMTNAGRISKRNTSHQAKKATISRSLLHHNISMTEHRKRSWTPEQLSDTNYLKVPASVWKNIHDPTRTEWIDAAEDTLTPTLAAGALLSKPVVGLVKV